MRKTTLFLLLFAFVAVPLFANDEGPKPTFEGVVDVPLPQLMRQLEASSIRDGRPRVTPNVVLEGAEFGFIFAVVGTAGAFRTEGVIVNRRNQAQRIVAFYWPIGGGAANCSLPARAYTLDPRTKYLFADLVPDLFPGQGGFGSVIIVGVTSSGEVDGNALIDGNARIWSLAAGGGTASQNFPSMSLMVPEGNQSAFGLRSDEFYRTNWGIFNYADSSRTFDILFDGFRGRQQISATIPPCSLVQQGVPGGPYGSLEIVFSPRDRGGLFYAYGSSVDNASSDAWSVPARQ